MPAPRPHLRVAFDLPSAVPGVWHADALGAGSQPAQPTGYALLDAQLPGGGTSAERQLRLFEQLGGTQAGHSALVGVVDSLAREFSAGLEQLDAAAPA